jgi:hypothetical protein
MTGVDDNGSGVILEGVRKRRQVASTAAAQRASRAGLIGPPSELCCRARPGEGSRMAEGSNFSPRIRLSHAETLE